MEMTFLGKKIEFKNDIRFYSEENLDAPKFKLREIADVMRNSIVGWVATQKTHRFNVYGPQKAWERVQHKADENGFMRVPEQMELPFD